MIRFYGILSQLEEALGGKRSLRDCHGRLPWPRRGVYFFFEEGERCSDSGDGLRVTRVGTHAVSTGSRTTLWKRLIQHRGSVRSGGGNHRGSIFRLLFGESLLGGLLLLCFLTAMIRTMANGYFGVNFHA